MGTPPIIITLSSASTRSAGSPTPPARRSAHMVSSFHFSFLVAPSTSTLPTLVLPRRVSSDSYPTQETEHPRHEVARVATHTELVLRRVLLHILRVCEGSSRPHSNTAFGLSSMSFLSSHASWPTRNLRGPPLQRSLFSSDHLPFRLGPVAPPFHHTYPESFREPKELWNNLLPLFTNESFGSFGSGHVAPRPVSSHARTHQRVDSQFPSHLFSEPAIGGGPHAVLPLSLHCKRRQRTV